MAWRVLSDYIMIGGVPSQAGQVSWNATECSTRAHHSRYGPSITVNDYNSISSGIGALSELNGDVYPVDHTYNLLNGFSIVRHVEDASFKFQCIYNSEMLSGCGVSGSDWRIRRWHIKCVILVNDDTEEAVMWFSDHEDTSNTASSSGGAKYFDNNQAHNFWLTIQGLIIPEFNLKSLRYVDGANGTRWFTKIPDDKINDGDYTTSFGSNDKWFDADDRSDLYQMSFGTILTVDTGSVSGKIEYIQGTPNYMRISYHSGDVTAVVNQNLDEDNFPGGITPLTRYLSIYEDSEEGVATFAVNAVHDEVGFFVEDLYLVNLNASAKTFLNNVGAEYLYKLIHAIPAPPDPSTTEDPYPFEADAGPSNYPGDGDSSSDPNELTPLPPSLASDIGFISLFNPSMSEMKELATYMWTDDLFDITNFKKLFADPMDCILGFMVYPFEITTKGIAELVVGNLGTDIRMHVASSEFVDIPMGYQMIPAPYASFLDNAPFTKLYVYLPFCGEHQLEVDRYSGKTVNISYRVNLLTGACIASLTDRSTNDLLGQFNGNMAYTIPLTATNYQNAISAIIGLTTGAVGLAAGTATGGALAGASIANMAQNVANLKSADIENAGSFSSSIGSVAHLAPYFKYVKPRLVNSTGKNAIIGQPSCIRKQLHELTGYVEVQNIHLSSDIATSSELSEIERILKEGVIINESLPVPE